MIKRALILTWSGFQDQEVIYPYYRLQEDGFSVDIAAETIGPVIGIFGTKFDATVVVKQLLTPVATIKSRIDLYDFLVLPGGVKALEKLRQQLIVLDFIHLWNSANKLIASICHGAQLLISARVVKGRKISGYYSIKDDIENAGGIYVDEPCVFSDNIVSSPHYKHMGVWMKYALDNYYELNSSSVL